MKVCPRCKLKQPIDAQFCGSCGHGFRTKFVAIPPINPVQTVQTIQPHPKRQILFPIIIFVLLFIGAIIFMRIQNSRPDRVDGSVTYYWKEISRQHSVLHITNRTGKDLTGIRITFPVSLERRIETTSTVQPATEHSYRENFPMEVGTETDVIYMVGDGVVSKSTRPDFTCDQSGVSFQAGD